MTTASTLLAPDLAAHIRARLLLVAAILLFLVAASLPYSWLIAHFGYDDILREPTAVILRNFQAGGAPLVLAWFGFAVGGLLFIPVALAFARPLSASWTLPQGTTTLGIVSASVQAVGLMRWVLVVPALAAAFADPATSPATRDVLVVVFDAVHRYGGMVVGEFIGQMLLAGWTALAALQLWRSRVVPRWLAAWGALTLPLWLLGQTELLHMVVPAVPSIEVIPLAFMAWEAWLLALAIALVWSAWRDARRLA